MNNFLILGAFLFLLCPPARAQTVPAVLPPATGGSPAADTAAVGSTPAASTDSRVSPYFFLGEFLQTQCQGLQGLKLTAPGSRCAKAKSLNTVIAFSLRPITSVCRENANLERARRSVQAEVKKCNDTAAKMANDVVQSSNEQIKFTADIDALRDAAAKQILVCASKLKPLDNAVSARRAALESGQGALPKPDGDLNRFKDDEPTCTVANRMQQAQVELLHSFFSNSVTVVKEVEAAVKQEINRLQTEAMDMGTGPKH